VALDDGRPVTRELYAGIRAEEFAALVGGADDSSPSRFDQAAEILDALVLAEDFPEFLTLVAYGRLD
jgi:malate synthase